MAERNLLHSITVFVERPLRAAAPGVSYEDHWFELIHAWRETTAHPKTTAVINVSLTTSQNRIFQELAFMFNCVCGTWRTRAETRVAQLRATWDSIFATQASMLFVSSRRCDLCNAISKQFPAVLFPDASLQIMNSLRVNDEPGWLRVWRFRLVACQWRVAKVTSRNRWRPDFLSHSSVTPKQCVLPRTST